MLHITRSKFLLTIIAVIALLPCFANATPKIMLGIDVLESMNFTPLKGKRVGLLTHPAGVNGYGESTISVLRRAKSKGVNLVALFGPEHGIYGDEKADVPVMNNIDKRTGLPVYSLYGKYRKPTAQMLANIDVLVVDLQSVGVRSYTFKSCMLRAAEACFENGKELMILDRPNPLGGLKVDGPMLDMEFKSYVGMFNTPYLHAMTIGELARMAKYTTGAMEIPSKNQKSGKLTIIPMRGWKRYMQWPDTGLKWTPTSPAVPTFGAAVGYAMTGLGCQIGGFQHGYGSGYPFRLLTFPSKTPQQIEQELRKFNIRGVSYKVATTKNAKGTPITGLYVLVNDWNTLRPTELSFYMMKLACKFNGGNVFATSSGSKISLYNKHVGSNAWWNELSKKGANANVEYFVNKWASDAAKFKTYSSKFYLYN